MFIWNAPRNSCFLCYGSGSFVVVITLVNSELINMNESAIRLWGSMAITSSKGEGTGDRAVGVGSNSRRQFQLALSTASALAVAFLLKEVHSSTMATPKYHTTTCLSGVCKASLNLKNQIFLRHNMSCIRAIRTTPAWTAGPPWLGWKSTSRRKISNIFGSKPNDHQVLYKRKLCSRTRQATLHALAQDDLEQSEQRQIESSTSARTSTVGPAPKQDAHHWFTELLPEGLCVGIHTSHDGASEMSRNEADSMVDASMLHLDEYQWGQEHYLSDNSRLSYYLGRMALRSALKTLLQTKNGDETTDQSITGDATQISFNAQIYSQIEATAIRKDYYGRPILPEIVGGSISHKKGYAVGLAQFRSSTWDSSNGIDKGLELDAGSVEWREECPIIDGNECVDMDNRGSPESPMASPVRGIGIDLEHANDDRGNRIEKRVLTSSEQKELGGLEDIGISRAEEVMLRFSLKESVYKAMHPILCQYVGFQEAEITPLPNGTARVTLNLTSGAHEDLGIVVQSVSWKKIGEFFLTSASAGVNTPNIS